MNIIKNSTFPRAARWNPAAWLRVAGPDAFPFLQGQFTNDLRQLEQTPAVYGLWLSVKGKVVADSFVLRDAAEPDVFWVGSYFSPPTVILERLESFIIADDVTVTDETSAWFGVSLLNDVATRITPSADVRWSFPGRRSAVPSVEWIFPTAARDAIERHLGQVEWVNEVELKQLRIAAAIPRVPGDLGPADLPNEAGLEAAAISYTKGCYLGQEVMARLKTMGQVRRRLLRVRGAGPAPLNLPAPVFAGEKAAGELRSATEDATGFAGLAMVSLLALAGRTTLALAPNAEPTVSLVDQP